MKKELEWVPCALQNDSRRLPDHTGIREDEWVPYLVTYRYKEPVGDPYIGFALHHDVDVNCYSTLWGWAKQGQMVIAWQSIPEAYTEG